MESPPGFGVRLFDTANARPAIGTDYPPMGIGTILLEKGMITRAQLEEAFSAQKESGERLDHVLVRLGFVSQGEVLRAIGEQFDMPIVDLTNITIEDKVLQALPAKLVYKQNCVPVSRENGTLRIATSPTTFELSAFDELRLLTGCKIELVLADEQELHQVHPRQLRRGRRHPR